VEKISKKILLVTTTGTTSDCNGNCRVIIPDLNAIYYIKFSLINETKDFGFFEVYDIEGEFDYIIPNNNFIGYLNGELPETSLNYAHSNGVISGETLENISYTVTGESKSRLSELKKYTITNNFNEQYKINGSIDTNGVDTNNTIVNNKIVYYIDGIKYTDIIQNNITIKTTFSFIKNSYNSLDFINKPIYKNMDKENIFDNPKIINNVFITRQELSAFENNYRLEFIKRLVDLETYASGKYFNIVNNN